MSLYSKYYNNNSEFIGNITLNANTSIFFIDQGIIHSKDMYHYIYFNRESNILEIREYGNIVINAGNQFDTTALASIYCISGAVGIYNPEPQYTLDVSGSINCSGNYYLNGSVLPTPPNLLYGSVLYDPLSGNTVLQSGSYNIISSSGYPSYLGIFNIRYIYTGLVPVITLTYGPLLGAGLSTTTVSLVDTSPILANISINPVPTSNVYIQVYGVYPSKIISNLTTYTQTYTLTSSQYSWTIAPMPNPYTPGNSILVVIPSGMANPAQFIQQLVNATQVSVTISLNFIASLSNLVSGSTEPKSTTYMQDADMSAVSGGTSTLTAVTRTVDTNTISGTTNINFIEYNDEGYISSLKYYGSITGVTLTITYVS